MLEEPRPRTNSSMTSWIKKHSPDKAVAKNVGDGAAVKPQHEYDMDVGDGEDGQDQDKVGHLGQ